MMMEGKKSVDESGLRSGCMIVRQVMASLGNLTRPQRQSFVYTHQAPGITPPT